jgi:hypothetical protein
MAKRNKEIEDLAKQKARETLSLSAGFQGLSRANQLEMYQNTIDDEYYNLAKAKGLIPSEENLVFEMGEKGASRKIDENRYVNKNLDKAGERMKGLVDAVNFPNFVRDLLKGVFDANMEVSINQAEQYQQLLKEATKSTADFVKGVSKADSYAYLAQNNDFTMDFGDDETGGGEPQPLLMDKDGNQVDTEDSKIKAKIADAQLAIAKERRKLLRETIMMGINRLVIDKGVVKSKVIFDIQSSSNVEKIDRATDKSTTSVGSTVKSSKPFWAPPWVPDISLETNFSKSSISISTNKGTQSDELKAQLTGEVEIQFKSDYFKLDNFASELEDLGGGRSAEGSAEAVEE